MTARMMALAVGALLGMVSPSAANDDVLIRGNLLYRLHVPIWPAVQPASKLAPWYQWWPADANQTLAQHNFQSSPYPAWPSSPPQAALASGPQGQLTYVSPPQPFQPNFFQPVSYPRSQVPSYWYGR